MVEKEVVLPLCSKLTNLLLRMRGIAQPFGICDCVECFKGVVGICQKKKKKVVISSTSLEISCIIVRLCTGRPSMGECR